jgi:hypothetical protein
VAITRGSRSSGRAVSDSPSERKVRQVRDFSKKLTCRRPRPQDHGPQDPPSLCELWRGDGVRVKVRVESVRTLEPRRQTRLRVKVRVRVENVRTLEPRCQIPDPKLRRQSGSRNEPQSPATSRRLRPSRMNPGYKFSHSSTVILRARILSACLSSIFNCATEKSGFYGIVCRFRPCTKNSCRAPR